MLVAFILVVAVELFSAVVHPVPPDFGGTMDEMCKHVERYPNWVLAIVVPAWAGTALAGTWIAGRLGNRGCAQVVGLLLLTALVFNISMLPYPIWFKVASVMVNASAVVAGVYWPSRRGMTSNVAG
jgi:hypothetical protein